jgi:CheY-like chemotaxis protein
MGGFGSSQKLDRDRLSDSSCPSDGQTDSRSHILIVEDNAADVYLIRASVSASTINAELHVVTDGEQAVRFFDDADRDSAAPCPELVLLDINLPRKHGGEVLEHMRRSPRCRHALVIVVSSSESIRDREAMAQLGANGYFRKPSDYSEFLKLGTMIKDLLRKE